MSENSLKHVAIIMDGNGRWAKQRLRPRIWGHVRGSHVVSDIVEAADSMALKSLTLYAFSSENWARPLEEVTVLFKLLRKFIIKEKQRILNNNIRFRVIGEVGHLAAETKALIRDLELASVNNNGLNLTFAFSYGSRNELVRAVNLARQNNVEKEITEEDISAHLYAPELGDVDLLIRTGGDQRISNFLLWQMAYGELFFTSTMWPDFSVKEFTQIVESVGKRERRFGGLGQVKSMDQAAQIGEQNRQSLKVEAANV